MGGVVPARALPAAPQDRSAAGRAANSRKPDNMALMTPVHGALSSSGAVNSPVNGTYPRFVPGG